MTIICIQTVGSIITKDKKWIQRVSNRNSHLNRRFYFYHFIEIGKTVAFLSDNCFVHIGHRTQAMVLLTQTLVKNLVMD